MCLAKVTEARLRLHEGAMANYAPAEQATSSIDSYLDSMRNPKHATVPLSSSGSGSAGSSYEIRRSPVIQPKVGTNLPFPRVHTSSSPALPRKLENPSPQFPKKSRPPVSISAAAAQSSRKPEPKNPFEDDEEEDKNNPFLEPTEPTKNPFEEDDYDSSLNPFAE